MNLQNIHTIRGSYTSLRTLLNEERGNSNGYAQSFAYTRKLIIIFHCKFAVFFLNKFLAFCLFSIPFTKLEQTGWPDSLKTLLSAARRVVQLIEAGHSVLVHCTDGWDRTPQITSLAQILLDPYYRTIEVKHLKFYLKSRVA